MYDLTRLRTHEVVFAHTTETLRWWYTFMFISGNTVTLLVAAQKQSTWQTWLFKQILFSRTV